MTKTTVSKQLDSISEQIATLSESNLKMTEQLKSLGNRIDTMDEKFSKLSVHVDRRFENLISRQEDTEANMYSFNQANRNLFSESRSSRNQTNNQRHNVSAFMSSETKNMHWLDQS